MEITCAADPEACGLTLMGLANTPVAKPATSTATARPVTIFSERVIFVFVIAVGFACRVMAVFHEKG
jgi:hypothetical protein